MTLKKWFTAATFGASMTLGLGSALAQCPSCNIDPEQLEEYLAEVTTWTSFHTPEDVQTRLTDPTVVLIDVRSAEQYAAGHLPGAINIPGEKFRASGNQVLARAADGSGDVKKYEALLSEAGITRENKVILYGSPSEDGSPLALVLHWLGHSTIEYFDGDAIALWKAEGKLLSTDPRKLPAAVYNAKVKDNFIVAAPGTAKAVSSDPADWSDPQTQVVHTPQKIRTKLAERKISTDETVVLHAHSPAGTIRPLIALRDLGYTNIVLVDGPQAGTPTAKR